MEKPLLFASKADYVAQCWPMRYKIWPICGLVVKEFLSFKDRHKVKEIVLPLLITEMLDIIHDCNQVVSTERANQRRMSKDVRTENHVFLKTYDITHCEPGPYSLESLLCELITLYF